MLPGTCVDLAREVLRHVRAFYPLPCEPWAGLADFFLPRTACVQVADDLRAHCAPCWWHALLRDLSDMTFVRAAAMRVWAACHPHLCGGEP